MYPDLYKGLNLKLEDLERYDSPLVGFDGRTVIPHGMIKLLVQAGDKEVQVNFIVVEAYSLYKAILARPWFHAMGTVSSTLHLKVKYPTQGRVSKLVGSQVVARQCLVAAIRQQSMDKTSVKGEEAPQQLTCPEGECRAESQKLLFEDSKKIPEELERSLIDTNKDMYFQIGARLPSEEKMELVDFLKSNLDVFAWNAYDRD